MMCKFFQFLGWMFYEAIFLFGVLVTGPYYLFRMRRRGGYANGFGERFGIYGAKARQNLLKLSHPIWIHAVSIGEVQMAFPLIEQLRRKNPGLDVILSVTTSTAYALAKEKEGTGLVVIYYPMDSRLFFARIHHLTQPSAFLVMEAELWPNHLLYCKRRGISLGLINARLSKRSFDNYRRFGFFFNRVIKAFDLMTLQCDADRQKLLELKARPEALTVIGSLKYGAVRSLDEAKREKLLQDLAFLKQKNVLVGASTHAGEEEILLEIWKKLKSSHPRLALVLAPRHVERKSEVSRLLKDAGIGFIYRSQPAEGNDVVLLDTTGDLRYVYELASVVFVGKSLCGSGGQNLMEPAWYGKAIVFGPHMQNFQPIVNDFLAAKAAIQVADRHELLKTIDDLLSGADQAYGQRAKTLMDSRQNVLERTVEIVERLLKSKK